MTMYNEDRLRALGRRESLSMPQPDEGTADLAAPDEATLDQMMDSLGQLEPIAKDKEKFRQGLDLLRESLGAGPQETATAVPTASGTEANLPQV